VQRSWLSFAREGRPEAEGLPTWAPYDEARRATLVLGRRPHLSLAPGEEERVFWEAHLARPGV
jgi:carboxylesterase type B